MSVLPNYEEWKKATDGLLDVVNRFLNSCEEAFFSPSGAFSKNTVSTDLENRKYHDNIKGGTTSYLYEKKQVYYKNIAEHYDLISNNFLPALNKYVPSHPYIKRLEDCLEHILALKQIVNHY